MSSKNTEYFHHKKVAVTDKLIVAGEKTYSLLNVNSVEVREIPASRGFGVVVIFLGAVMVACTIIATAFSNMLFAMSNPGESNVAVIFSTAGPPIFCGAMSMAIGLIVLVMAKKHYAVEISYPGEQDKTVFTSRSRNEVEEISGAIRQALEKVSSKVSKGIDEV